MFNREAQCSQKGAKELTDKLQGSEEADLATICDGADQVFLFGCLLVVLLKLFFGLHKLIKKILSSNLISWALNYYFLKL